MPLYSRLIAMSAAIVAVATTDAFSNSNSILPTRTSNAATSLNMGIFDSISKAFSNEEYGAPPDAVKATARHILVPTEQDAKDVMQKFASGETSFAALAGQYSTCPSRSQGGSLGSFSPGTMVKEFDDVVFNPETKAGEIMGPVKTQFGYHLIVVDKRTGGGDWY